MNANEAFEQLDYHYHSVLSSIEEKVEVEKFKQLFLKWAIQPNKRPKNIKIKKNSKKKQD